MFQAARGLPAVERSGYLRKACEGDERLRRRVDVLLEHDEQPRINLEKAISGVARAASEAFLRKADLPIPSRIGAYRILRQLGEGGFGVVYLAEQESPRRTVGLTVVRWSASSSDALRRFEHETHVLGQLQHPGIAQIFEAGVAEMTFEAGGVPAARVPYYTMEYIQ